MDIGKLITNFILSVGHQKEAPPASDAARGGEGEPVAGKLALREHLAIIKGKRLFPRSEEKIPAESFSQVSGSLMNDSRGRIKHLAFQFNADYGGPDVRKKLLNVYGTIIDKMKGDVKFIFLVRNEKDADILAGMLKQKNNPDRFEVIISREKKLDIWGRDSAIPLKTSGGIKILFFKRSMMGKSDAGESAQSAFKKTNMPAYVMEDICMEGGDLMAGPGYVFIGNQPFLRTKRNFEKRCAADKKFNDFIINLYKEKNNIKIIDENKLGDEVFFDKVLNEATVYIYEKIFQSKVYIIGMDNPATKTVENQPAFHIDMCVTPIDEKTVLLGDPKMTLRRLFDLKMNDPEALKEYCEKMKIYYPNFESYLVEQQFKYDPAGLFYQLKEIKKKDVDEYENIRNMIFAELAMSHNYESDKKFDRWVETNNPGVLIEELENLRSSGDARYKEKLIKFCVDSGIPEERMEELFKTKDERYGNVETTKKQLEEQGFKVIRAPHLQGQDPGTIGGTVPTFTYNNCLMNDYTDENGRRVKQVFLPVYGIKDIDEAAIKIYKDLGYEVIPVEGFEQITKHKGALRCLCQVLDKS